MKRFSLILFAQAIALLIISCISVSDDVGNAFAEMDIVFHTKKYMKDQDLKVPDGVNETRFSKLPFQVAFLKSDARQNGQLVSADIITEKEFNEFKKEFEAVIDATRRFPLSQRVNGLADSDLRQMVRNGSVNVAELDVSEMEEAQYILNVTADMTYTTSQVGYQKKMVTRITLTCNPVEAKNNKPISWFPSTILPAQTTLYAKTDATGLVVDGVSTYSAGKREALHNEVFRKALVKFIDHIYNSFPTGGVVSDIDGDMVSVKASRATGLQPDMEMVVYAREKGNPDAMRIPLYNATLVTMAQEGNSELKIWRKTSSDRGKSIIKMIKNDFPAAREQYDFFAASSGIPKSPDFIKVSGDAQ